MGTLKFQFYPPKKQQDISLVPNSSIVGVSALMPKSTAARKKKKDSIRRKNGIMLPPFGPTQAMGMGSDTSGNRGGDAPASTGPGYGNSQYGARAYGEAIGKIKNTTKRKGYSIYSNSVNICESID